MKPLLRLFRLGLLVLVASFALASCASSRVAWHSFCFNVDYDNQNAVILDFRYGNDAMTSSPRELVKQGHEFHADCVGGPMQIGDFLYVKWRDKVTNKIYEDNVDLRHRLPWSMEGKTITFMVRGSQLYVYVVDEHKLRTDNMPAIGPWMYQGNQVIMIYPDQPIS